VPLRVFNMGDKPVILYKNTVAAVCSPVDIIETRSGLTSPSEEISDLPQHLSKIYEEGCEFLESNQCQQLQELLKEYSSVFSF